MTVMLSPGMQRRPELSPPTQAEFEALCGTRRPGLSQAARFWHSARSLGALRVARKLLRRSDRRHSRTPATTPNEHLDALKQCSWLGQLPGIRLVDGLITTAELLAFQQELCYPKYYYYAERRIRYSLWHHVGLQLAKLSPSSVVLDVGAQAGLWGRMVRRRIGCRVIDLDREYRRGHCGDRIGASANKIPLDDSQLTHIVSFCAFNCFEGNDDSALIKEAARVLRPGGRLIIVPLCIGDAYVNLYDPQLVGDVHRLDSRASSAAVPGWGNPFGRWYDRRAFQERFLDHASAFDIEIHRILHPFHHDEGFEAMFAARLTRLYPIS